MLKIIRNALARMMGKFHSSKNKKDLEDDGSTSLEPTEQQAREQPFDRHSTDNMLGPVLLSGTLPDKVRECVWKKRPDWKSKYKQEEFVKFTGGGNGDIPNLNGAKILLVDDQVECGWIDILYGWAYGACTDNSLTGTHENGGYQSHRDQQDSDKVIYSATDKEGSGYTSSIINKLYGIATAGDTEKNCYFSLNFIDNEDTILVFDLYLFPGEVEKENKYFDNVLDLAEDLKKKKLLDSEEAEGLLDLCNTVSQKFRKKGGRINITKDDHSEVYLGCLTLLPRLITYFDPSIPIIVFSAASARGLDTIFKSYKNIFVAEKPRFSGTFRYTNAEKIKKDFIVALNKSASFIKVRKCLRTFERTARRVP